jgi:hypothetical protein
VGIGRIQALLAISFEVVSVDLRRKRLGDDGPDAGGVFFHRDGFGYPVEGERDLRCRSIFVGEGDGVIGVDFCRPKTRGLLRSKRERCGECEEQREFVGGDAGCKEVHMRQFSREAQVVAMLTSA